MGRSGRGGTLDGGWSRDVIARGGQMTITPRIARRAFLEWLGERKPPGLAIQQRRGSGTLTRVVGTSR